MPLLEAIPFLKGAVARNLPGGALSKYVFDNGWIYAESAAVLAAYPMPHIQGKFGLAAEPLEAALKRMPTEPAVSAGDGSLIFKAGRLRSELQLFETEAPEGEAEANWEPCPASLWPALVAARPFISKDGSWQRAAWLMQGRVIGMSNISCIEVMADGLDLMLSAAGLVDSVVDYLGELPPPERWHEHGESALWFGWPSGAWVRCCLSSTTMPMRGVKCVFDHVVDAVPREGAIDITTEFREAFADAAALGDGTCSLGPEGFIAKGAHAHDEHHAELPTGCSRDTTWRIPVLTPVIEQAMEWCPDAQGPAYFSGKGIRGVVVGIAR